MNNQEFPISEHAQWPNAQWERRALEIDRARDVLRPEDFKIFMTRFERHIRHAQEIEDSSKCGKAYREKALETHAHMMLLAKSTEHWRQIALSQGGVK